MSDKEPQHRLQLAYAIVKQCRDDPLKPEVLTVALDVLIPEARQNGLNTECFKDLVVILCIPNLNSKLYTSILEALIPNEIVTDDIIDLLMCLYQTNIWTDTNLCEKLLNWFSVLIYCGLIDLNKFRTYFNSLHKGLKVTKFIHPLVLVLRGLLHPSIITPRLVNLTKFYYEESQARDILFLLNEMKNLRPEIITDVFPPVKSLKPKINDEVLAAFTKVATQCCSEIGLKRINNVDTKSKKLAPRFIKGPHKADNGVSIFSISSLEELVNEWERIVLPYNLLSLTQSEYGIFILLSGDSELENRFEVQLQGEKSYKELLYPLLKFSNFFLCGLPGVSKYILPKLMLTWDGVTDSQVIMPLLKWTWFNNYDELRSLLLVPLSRIYVTVGSNRKAKIICCLKQLMVHMINIELERTSRGLKRPFETPTMAWLEDELVLKDTLDKLILAVNKLIVIGILMESPNSTPIFLEGLLFYEEISKLFTEKSLLSFPILPSALVYGSFLSPNFLIIRKLCSLLSYYISTVLPHFEGLGIPEFATHIQTIKDYADDIYSFIWSGKGSETKLATHINFSEGLCKMFSVKNHQAIFPAVHFFAKKSNLPLSDIPDLTLLELFSSISSEVANFIRLQAPHFSGMEIAS